MSAYISNYKSKIFELVQMMSFLSHQIQNQNISSKVRNDFGKCLSKLNLFIRKLLIYNVNMMY